MLFLASNRFQLSVTFLFDAFHSFNGPFCSPNLLFCLTFHSFILHISSPLSLADSRDTLTGLIIVSDGMQIQNLSRKNLRNHFQFF